MRKVTLKDQSVLLPAIKNLLLKATKNKTIYGAEIVQYCNDNLELESKLSEPKLRYLINVLRQQEVPVLSSTSGYWISYNKTEILETIVSLNSRITSIKSAIGGLNQCIINIDMVDEWSKKGINI